MSPEPLVYQSYLLRLWRALGGDQRAWRASLEDTLTGQRTGFADLDALCAFLHAQTGTHPAPGREPGQVETVPGTPLEEYHATHQAPAGDV